MKQPPSVRCALGVLACLLGLAAGIGGPARAAENLRGTWVSEPVMTQLGMMQTTYTFKGGGRFVQKQDFKHACGRNPAKPDCRYFWKFWEGRYALVGDRLTLSVTKGYSETLRVGETRPQIREDKLSAAMVREYTLALASGTLTLTDGKRGRSDAFYRMGERQQ